MSSNCLKLSPLTTFVFLSQSKSKRSVIDCSQYPCRYVKVRVIFSEVFPVEELVASAEDDVAGVAELILLSHVAHVEEFLVVQDEQ